MIENPDKTYLGYTGSDIQTFKKYAAYTLFTFSIMYVFFYNGRQNIGLALPAMQSEMGWSKSDMGIISSVLFWTYGFGHLVNGRLGEILGPKRFIIVGVILSVICNVIISYQNTIVAIAVLWGLNGGASHLCLTLFLVLSPCFPDKVDIIFLYPEDNHGQEICRFQEQAVHRLACA